MVLISGSRLCLALEAGKCCSSVLDVVQLLTTLFDRATLITSWESKMYAEDIRTRSAGRDLVEKYITKLER
jgi:hypothetical protein